MSNAYAKPNLFTYPSTMKLAVTKVATTVLSTAVMVKAREKMKAAADGDGMSGYSSVQACAWLIYKSGREA